MSILELKEGIRKRLERTQDKLLLEAIHDMLDGSDEVVKFTPEQHARVMRGLEQMRNGQVTSDEDVQREIREWLKEK